ncbi:ABC transporter substrate-binding protein [Vallitalea okinawensis]|uniref:ABC transporter substrate-binding protein n=1 Tax=Vallitalea okinawensis TaxID=2078660 RepID=UPI000CFADB13|nr:extracellular solute-binding protein [Vallitalea okinawensis]
MKKCLSGLIIFLFLFMIACTNTDGGNNQSEKKEENGDKTPNTLELWTPVDVELMEGWVSAYQTENPNITIIIQEHTWEEYWSKLPLAMKSGNGPDLFYQNTLYLQNTIEYSEPYDDSIIKKNEVENNYSHIESHFIDDEIYYVPMGYYTGIIMYDESAWEQKGFDGTNYPKTWEELIAMANEFELFDQDGKMVRNGFTYAGMEEALVWSLNYQQGMPMFTADGIPNINTNITMKSIEIMGELNNDYKNVTPGWKQLADGYVVMAYGYGADYARLKEEYPNIDVGIMSIPKMDDQVAVVESKSMEISLGISKYIKEDNKSNANEFIKFIINNEQLLTEYAVHKGAYPARSSLKDASEIAENHLFQVQGSYINQSMYPGPIPETLHRVYDRLFEEILQEEKELDVALMDAQKEAEEIVSEINFKPVEDQYDFYDDLQFK